MLAREFDKLMQKLSPSSSSLLEIFHSCDYTGPMNHKAAILYGIVIWAATILVAMIIFPLRSSDRVLFESIMPVVLTLATIKASYFYFRKVKARFVMQGLCLGITWVIISLILDGLVFSWGPMKMGLTDYLKDIAVSYLIVLFIPWGFGYVRALK